MSRICASQSQVLVVDIQEKLYPALSQADDLVGSAARLLGVARELGLPVVVTEQYPKGLGHTVEALAEELREARVIEKIHFSAWQESAVQQALEARQRPQVVLLGAEAHVCVLQTALDLQQAGYQVKLVADAIASRDPANKELAMARLRQAGGEVVSVEMVAFEWLYRADHPQFKQVSQNYLK